MYVFYLALCLLSFLTNAPAAPGFFDLMVEDLFGFGGAVLCMPPSAWFIFIFFGGEGEGDRVVSV